MKERINLRSGTLKDLDELVKLEGQLFGADRFKKEQLRYLLTKARATVFVLEYRGRVAGMAIMLWRKKLAVGRLYDIVIDRTLQRHGFGERLLDKCETAAVEKGCTKISLEVRTDNKRAIGFYENHGYRTHRLLPDYYADGAAGLRMVKQLKASRPNRVSLKIPYYAQSQEFTCGPACLMMAFKYFKPTLKIGRTLEMTLWKESTLIFTTSGIGGTGPFGLALAAQRRGFRTNVILSKEQTPFFSSVRTTEKREVIRLVHEDLKAKAIAQGIGAEYFDFGFDEIADGICQGRIPIVLVSTYRLYRERAPHWVVVTGYDAHNVYFHDPYERFYGKSGDKARNVPISIREFRHMRRYGKDIQKCVVFVGPLDIKPVMEIDGSIPAPEP